VLEVDALKEIKERYKMKTNIPIYRAKKIDSDEYVEGYVFPSFGSCVIWIYDDIEIETTAHTIDPSTLAIHFPDMIDSEGTKIFASLSEDGKGGDIVNLNYNYLIETIKIDKYLFVRNYDKAKVTGIQE